MYEELMSGIHEYIFGLKEEHLRDQVDDGNIDAMYLLAKLYWEDFQIEKAFKWFKKAAENGQADAIYYIGNYYWHPDGWGIVESNEEKANEYYSKAVELGSAMAMCKLGWQYRQGTDLVERNEAKAIELFEKAAELGYHQAFSWLAKCYKYGNGVEKNIEKAFDYALKAYEILNDENL